MITIVALDHLARAWVATHRFGPLDGIMWTLSAVGRGGIVWLAAAATFAIGQRRPRTFWRVALSILLATLVADYAIKPLVGRQRPFIETRDVRVIGGQPRDASFPSGHAADAFAGALALSRAVPGAWAAWWSLAIAIAYSRVYLGVHYPLDVAAGALVGLACATLVLTIATRPRKAAG